MFINLFILSANISSTLAKGEALRTPRGTDKMLEVQ